MRILSTAAVLAVLATVPLASHSQTRPADDHSTHKPAQAQPPGAPAAPGGMDMKSGGSGAMMGGGMMHGGMMGHMPLKHIEGRLAFLKTELKITPAQEPQWTKFAESVRGIAKNALAAAPPCFIGGVDRARPPRPVREDAGLTA